MEQNTNTNTTRRTIRRLNRKVGRRNVAIVLLVIPALLLLGHVVWCLTHHMDNQKCTVCGQTETNCLCAAQMNKMSEKINELNIQLTDAQIQLEEALREECAHEEVETIEGEPHWKYIVGEKYLCRKGERVISAKCKKCGEVIATKTEEVEDSSHRFNGDEECDDCGYGKLYDNGGDDDDYRPTKEPVKPTATPTPPVRPTVTPTPTPTVEPTAAPCTHEHTMTDATEWSWWSVGTPSVCGIEERHVKVTCLDCGATTKDEDQSRNDLEHNFKGHQCQKCAYRKELSSGYGSAEGTVPSGNEWTYSDGEVASPVWEWDFSEVDESAFEAGSTSESFDFSDSDFVWEDDEVPAPVN